MSGTLHTLLLFVGPWTLSVPQGLICGLPLLLPSHTRCFEALLHLLGRIISCLLGCGCISSHLFIRSNTHLETTWISDILAILPQPPNASDESITRPHPLITLLYRLHSTMIILEEKMPGLPPPPPYSPGGNAAPSFPPPFPYSSRERPTLGTLPSHLLLRTVYLTFTNASCLEKQRKTLYWLAVSLRMVNRAFYVGE